MVSSQHHTHTQMTYATLIIAGKDIRFEQNSKEMYDNILNGTPWFARKQAQAKLDDAVISVEARNGVITENDMLKSLSSRRQSYFYNRALKCWMDIRLMFHWQ